MRVEFSPAAYTVRPVRITGLLTTSTPVIGTGSALRHITPYWSRNIRMTAPTASGTQGGRQRGDAGAVCQLLLVVGEAEGEALGLLPPVAGVGPIGQEAQGETAEAVGQAVAVRHLAEGAELAVGLGDRVQARVDRRGAGRLGDLGRSDGQGRRRGGRGRGAAGLDAGQAVLLALADLDLVAELLGVVEQDVGLGELLGGGARLLGEGLRGVELLLAAGLEDVNRFHGFPWWCAGGGPKTKRGHEPRQGDSLAWIRAQRRQSESAALVARNVGPRFDA